MCSVCGQLSGCCSGGPGSGCVRQCITAQVRLYNLGIFEGHVGLFGMASGTVEGSPSLYDFGQWNGQNSHGLGRHSPNVWLQGPQTVGYVAQNFEDRSLKAQTQLMFGDVGMAGPIYKE